MEAELRHAALELVGGPARVLERERSERHVAVRVLGDHRRERVVGAGGRRGCLAGIDDVLDARCGKREHSDLDPGGVHRCEPRSVGVLERVGHRLPLVGVPADARKDRVFQGRRDEVLFKGDFPLHPLCPLDRASSVCAANLVRLRRRHYV